MREIDACIFCTTPYQVCTAVGMIMTLESKNVDLYILDQFTGADKLAHNIEKKEIVSRVVLVDDTGLKKKYWYGKHKWAGRLRRAITYATIKHFASFVLIPETKYKRMYVSSKAIIPNLIYMFFVKTKQQMEFLYFDDGEGSYDNDDIFKPRRIDLIAKRAFFGKAGTVYEYPRYLYSQSLFKSINHNSIEIRELPRFWNNPEYQSIIREIFETGKETYIAERVVILETLRRAWKKNKCDAIDKAYHQIEAVVGRDNIIVKRHPRDDSELFGLKVYENSGIPFEILCMENDIENKILVAYASTGVTTPKILFDKEPYTIMLYKLIDVDGVKPETDRFYHSCQALYRNKKRFFIPENEDQFEEAIMAINNGVRNA